ncbi:hypothetical protein MTR67_011525 [Solanum verrucosum]|uniref:Dual-specificity RNA methyltransferase RlmN N-terminal domain-containing protein n=1 Tax=Solanum verrucosum TaxID=315347 RepID=A0AAF0Q9K1_SOLVR|nr:hypothetical protein MTR67_011525 [Solanum verrucosum]
MAMGALQSGCSVSFARALRSRTFTTISSTVTVPSLKKASQMESRLLLGLSEEQLQQLALDFGQKSFRGKQLYHLLYKRKVKEIQEFSQLPLEFRNDLQEAGWRVGRSPIHKAVTAADGTTKSKPHFLKYAVLIRTSFTYESSCFAFSVPSSDVVMISNNTGFSTFLLILQWKLIFLSMDCIIL